MEKAEKKTTKRCYQCNIKLGAIVCDSYCTGFKNISFWYESKKKKNNKGKTKSTKMKY